MTLFERVKTTADMRGYSLAELSRKAGIGEKSIYAWRPSKNYPEGINPKRVTLQKIADVLGVSTDYLLGTTDEMMPKNIKQMPKVDLYEVDDSERDELISANGQPISDEDWVVIKAILSKYPKKHEE